MSVYLIGNLHTSEGGTVGTNRQVLAEDYLWKTEPYAHQREVFLRSRDEESFGYLMGMGTGKTKVTIDVAAYNYSKGVIDCLVVVAPNGVHRNWISREIPTHMPDWTNCRAAIWASEMRVKEAKAVESLLDPDFKGLRVVSLNIEAFRDSTKCKAARLVRKLLNCFNVMMVVDESSKIKTPGAKRTRALEVLGKHAVMRRILTGTPVTNGPLDIFSQFNFLGRDLLGFDNFYSFKHYYAEWEQERNFKTGQEYEVLSGYRNLDELIETIDRHSYRITKEECLDLPEKIYTTRYVEMTMTQRKMYNDLVQRSLIELEDGEEMSVAHVLTKLLRLQQVVGGFIPKEEFAPAEAIEDRNVRIDCLMDILEESEGKVIIWARFRAELAAIENAIRKKYGKESVVSYHGGVGKDDREHNMDTFQDPASPVKFFVGQQHSGGYGLTLHAATTVVYYSNDFSLEARLQSEDRAHRIGQHHSVVYVDIECVGTVDSKIIEALRNKMSLADTITRDSVRQLLAKVS